MTRARSSSDGQNNATTTSGTCATCDAPALVRCTRCDAALCADHAPLAGYLCRACEDAYTKARVKLTLWPWFLLPFLSAFTYLALNLRELWTAGPYSSRGFTGYPFFDVLIYMVVAGLLFGSLGRALRVAVFNYRFRR